MSDYRDKTRPLPAQCKAEGKQQVAEQEILVKHKEKSYSQ